MKWVIGCTFLVLVVGYFMINHYVIMNKMNKASFNDKITKVTHDEKSQPTVYIGNTNYTFPFGREKGDFMVNDSLVKKANTTVIYQYRKGKFIKKYSW